MVGKPYPDSFEEYWQSTAKRHGKRLGKRATFREWRKEVGAGASEADLLRASRAYTKYCEENDVFPKDPERFLSQGVWEDFINEPEPVTMVKVEDAQIAASYYESIEKKTIAEKLRSANPPNWAMIVPEEFIKQWRTRKQ